MKIKHSKFKNTGLLFELLVRQITADTLQGKSSPAIDILKEYFVKTELGKEYKLYETILKSQTLNESKANVVLSTILESSQKLNRKLIKRAKYNLIKEIKENYNLDQFFKSKIKGYKKLASLYTLIEGYNSSEISDTTQIVNSKITLLEYLTNQQVNSEDVEDEVLKEFQTYDKSVRILTYKILLEKFNDKHENLSPSQKLVLKEFINSVDSTPKLKSFYNSQVLEIKQQLSEQSVNIKDKATKIKITEVSKMLKELTKTDKISQDNMVDLLQYHGLVEEIKKSNV